MLQGGMGLVKGDTSRGEENRGDATNREGER
jgi:hypothetical protein